MMWVTLKSLLFGVAGAFTAVLLWMIATLILPIVAPYLVTRISGDGGVGVGYVTSNSLLLAALIGFVVAFAWERYRLRG
jgi:hypothetical protein